MTTAPNPASRPPAAVSLDDKYRLTSGRVFISGTQALVRLAITQALRDRRDGLRTAGYVTGYRGSPLGGLDQQMVRASGELAAHDVHFHPAVNEEIAATAAWGTQQAEAAGEGAYDGVFAMWYGKGPGVDRSGDALRHANLAGSSKHGGVLVLMGDDHTCESSTTCHQSEFALVDAMIPILSPAGVQEILDFGVLGWGLSRYSGCWVGMKCVKDTVESTASIDVDIDRVRIALPPPPDVPDGLNLRQPDTPHAQEARLHRHKIGAVKAFARANGIDRVVADAPNASIGIATHGKSYLDVLQALHELGLAPASAAALGVRLYKVGMTWPLEPEGAKAFSAGLKKIVVVEEKRSLVETQLKELLYGEASASAIVGKRDEHGETLFQAEMALDPVQIAIAIGERMVQSLPDVPASIAGRLDVLRGRRAPRGVVDVVARSFYFCSGCPHNTSTVIPEGSKAYAGIGCHWMAQAMNRSTTGYTQMGGEGAAWMGESRFSRRKHMFQNMGDGTYFHSGLLAIRAAVAARTNVTFKILFNDAVAMTGGQRHDGQLDVPAIASQLRAEGIERIAIVAEEPGKYRDTSRLPPRVSVHAREDLDVVQAELREIEGTSALVYDQVCAAEKRRRRKRGLMPEAATRVFINDLVCEGCGDCGLKSNCVSIHPLETEFGRKRTIDQSSCNGDVSCVKGFCPSFVTVTGGKLRRTAAAEHAPVPAATLPDPAPALANGDSCSILVAGMGGTGVVTVGAILGMAAHLDGLGCGILDMAGLAQKGGSVWSHIRIARSPETIAAIRIAPGGADVVLGCDQIVAANSKTLSLARAGSRAIVNTAEVMPGAFALDGGMEYPRTALRSNVERVVEAGNVELVDATRLALALCGDAVYANLLLVGVAFQRGLVPVSANAIEQAIALNGTEADANRAAFEWGRRWALDPAACEAAARASSPAGRAMLSPAPVDDLERAIELRREFLEAYQDRDYADRYAKLVAEVREAERALHRGRPELTHAVAQSYFKLLAVKDEYEVARLHVDTGFVERVRAQFDGDAKVAFHMAPPILGTRRSHSGEPRKTAFGPWMIPLLRVLARMRGLRGSALDVFRHSAERRADRELLAQYESDVRAVLDVMRGPHGRAKRGVAMALASLPMEIRGYGHVRMRAIEKARAEAIALRAGLAEPVPEAIEEPST
ncbi:MAG: indolepyruvate ferredoxin oxidoreductase family protein [Burkholderiales bacterium]